MPDFMQVNDASRPEEVAGLLGRAAEAKRTGKKLLEVGGRLIFGKPVDPMPAISVFMHPRRSAETDDDWERVISCQVAVITCEWEAS